MYLSGSERSLAAWALSERAVRITCLFRNLFRSYENQHVANPPFRHAAYGPLVSRPQTESEFHIMIMHLPAVIRRVQKPAWGANKLPIACHLSSPFELDRSRLAHISMRQLSTVSSDKRRDKT
jgi:hypothetical protein